MSETSPYTSNIRINARFSPRDFVPDGDLTKKAWKRAEWVRFDHDMSGQRAYPDADTQVAACWTGAYVYFAFRCKFTTLNVYEGEDPAKERWELWNRDVAEVFVNPEPARVKHGSPYCARLAGDILGLGFAGSRPCQKTDQNSREHEQLPVV